MRKYNKQLLTAAITAVMTLLPGLGATAGASSNITEYSVPDVNDSPYPLEIATGSDGALWFTENGTNNIGRITTSGELTEYPILSPPGKTYPAKPNGITAGPDGSLWFTEGPYNIVSKITTGGDITQYTLPLPPSGTSYPPTYYPTEITSGPDGALWFTEPHGNSIGRISTSGDITEYQLSSTQLEDGPFGITTGPDGALWFTDDATNSIGRITTTGTVTEYPIPSAGSSPRQITSGPDGALWFTENSANKIGRITTTGTVTEYPVTTSGSYPYGITSGPDGALWFTESGPSSYNGSVKPSNIGRITTSGSITEYPTPTVNGSPYGITSGPDGALWFTENRFFKIGRITVPSIQAPSNLSVAASPTKEPQLSWSEVNGAEHYDVYRDGEKIDSTATPNYTDTSADDGTHSYYVKATAGELASDSSNTVTVTVDKTAPVVTVTPAAGSVLSGTVTFNITVSDSNPLDANKNKSVWVYLYNTAGSQKSSGAKVNLSNGSGAFTVDTTKLNNGNANLDVGIVYDAAGNASGKSDNYFRNYTVNN